jgi:hypothetical protein
MEPAEFESAISSVKVGKSNGDAPRGGRQRGHAKLATTDRHLSVLSSSESMTGITSIG